MSSDIWIVEKVTCFDFKDLAIIPEITSMTSGIPGRNELKLVAFLTIL